MERLPEIVYGERRDVTAPMQGSGAFAVEAMRPTFAPVRSRGRRETKDG
jgi:hypothetical protein